MRTPSLVILFLGILGCGTLLAFTIDQKISPLNPEITQQDPLFRLMGSAKELVGDMVFLKADSYFHAGLQFDLLRYVREKHETEEVDEHEKALPLETLIGSDWVAKVNSRVGITEHKHMSDKDVQEILPLLYASTSLNPHNVSAALTAAYWVESQSKNMDQSIRILEDALKNNPDSWELDLKLGEIYLTKKPEPAKSLFYLEGAARLIDPKTAMATEQRLVYYLLGQAYEKNGRSSDAVQSYQKALTFFGPSESIFVKSDIESRLKALQL